MPKTHIFISKAQAVHGDRYSYLSTVYKSSKSKVAIICSDHGLFHQSPSHHLNGTGCPACANNVRITKDQFITRANTLHGNKFCYQLANYKNCDTRVEITCPDHGTFTQTPYAHLNGSGCPGCGLTKKKMARRLTTEQFVNQAKAVHGEKYDYRRTRYVKATKKVEVVCPTHGPFWQLPNSHIGKRAYGCPTCGIGVRANKRRNTNAFFIESALKVHGVKYDYSLVNYESKNINVVIICPTHGEFKQTPGNHLSNKGCVLCAYQDTANRLTLTTEQFIRGVKTKAHSDTDYGYSKVNYVSAKNKVEIVCDKHGVFLQTPDSHTSGAGCPKCANVTSKPEIELVSFLQEILPDYTTIDSSRHQELTDEHLILCNNRGLIPSLNTVPNVFAELDIVLPSLGIAIEFNGIHFHSSKYKDSDYHLKKTEACKKAGLRLVHIWEDDWYERKDVLKGFLKSMLLPIPTVFGRKTKFGSVDKDLAKVFLEANHIQGATNFSESYGLYLDGEVVSVCTYTLRDYGYELTRHACKYGVRVVGALGKHIKNFNKLHPGTTVKSFCDLSIFDGGSYKKAGFELEHTLSPDYKYVINAQRKHKFAFRRKHLQNFLGKKFDQELSEVKNMENNGFYRIFDCGKLRFIYK